MNTLVFTSVDGNFLPSMIFEWLISLRTLGKYSGEILILDYGMSARMKRRISKFGVKIKQGTQELEELPNKRFEIVNQRYFDMIPLLDEEYKDYVVAHFDADIWFQDDIRDLFEMAKRHRIAFTPDVPSFTQGYRGSPDPVREELYRQKVQKLRATYGSTINGGVFAGCAGSISGLFKDFLGLVEQGFLQNGPRANQFCLNYLFDFEKDVADAHLWNCIGRDCFLKDGVWYSRITGQKVIAQHITGAVRHEKIRYFRYLHKDILDRECPEWQRLEFRSLLFGLKIALRKHLDKMKKSKK